MLLKRHLLEMPGKSLPPGSVVTLLFSEERWILGTPIGEGTYGQIYLAIPDGSESSSFETAKHVIKIVRYGAAT